MNFEKIKQIMTKEEFFEEKAGSCGCPHKFGFKNQHEGDCDGITCKDCWSKVIDKNNIKFKGDTTTTEEQKVIDALKVVKNYCDDKELCIGCKFDLFGDCMLKKHTKRIPIEFEIDALENLLKPQAVIYKVEHREGQQHYDFVADKELPIGTMVVCDTCEGHSYGRIVAITKGIDDGYKKCWEVE